MTAQTCSDPCGEVARESADDALAIERFAAHMFAKLRANMHKAHWSTVEEAWLFARLVEEVGELAAALLAHDEDAIRDECADVGNFAMMIHEWRGR